MIAIGSRLEEMRVRSGLTASQVASKLNVSNVTVRNWEKGKGIPNYEGLARLYGVTVGALTGEELVSVPEDSIPAEPAVDGVVEELVAEAEEVLHHNGQGNGTEPDVVVETITFTVAPRAEDDHETAKGSPHHREELVLSVGDKGKIGFTVDAEWLCLPTEVLRVIFSVREVLQDIVDEADEEDHITLQHFS